MADAADALRQSQTSIAVFPEGTRGRGDVIGKMKKGPFHLAQLAGVASLPIGIRGTAPLMPRENTGIRSGVIEVHIGKPIAPIPRDNREARNALMNEVRAEVARLAGMPPPSRDEPRSARARAAE
jgi:1-acyl-sn-glycerol-3-phosphate acyltransferase